MSANKTMPVFAGTIDGKLIVTREFTGMDWKQVVGLVLRIVPSRQDDKVQQLAPVFSS